LGVVYPFRFNTNKFTFAYWQDKKKLIKMLVYFDNCAIQQPLDDKSNFRIRLEAEAMIVLIEMIENGSLKMVASDVLIFEINNTPDPERVNFSLKFLSLGISNLSLTNHIIDIAKQYEKQGIKPIDALHLAMATENNVDYLCTCDDRFLKRAGEIININTRIILPTDLVMEV
jgi:predicted nucleic acid-binding protein